jgi:hypothetical protein
VADNEIIPDGTTLFSGGQNAAISPGSLAANQYSYGINVSTQKTSLTPRWGIVQKPLDFTDTGSFIRATGFSVTCEEIFYSGKMQAFIPYGIGPDRYNIYIISGFIFLISLSDFKVQVLNILDLLNVYADRVNWSNAGEYLVIFDWPNRPFIFDGVTIKRADPALYEVPASVLGTYNQNRLCIGNAGIDWTAGDPSGSVYAAGAPVTFEEIMIPSSPYVGDVYQVPTANKNADKITAMGFLQVLDTSMGIGPLLVATDKAIYSYATNQPRTNWQGGTTSAVFGSAVLYNSGIVGQRAHVNVGGDIIFLSHDGQIRALTMARNEVARWSNSPISREVENFLVYNDPDISYVAATAHFMNKIFVTCNPYRVDCTSAEGYPQTDYVNGGAVVMEIDNTAGLLNNTPPAWAGMWTGVQFTDFAENDGVLYIAGKHRGRNGMFAFDPSISHDIIDDEVRLVRSVVLTKEYVHGDQSINKQIHSLDLGLRNLEETVTVSVDYKPSTTGTFTHWRDEVFNAPVQQCSFMPKYPQGLDPQGIRDLNFGGVNENVCDPSSGLFMDVYKGLQLRLIIEGKYWELEYIKLKAKILRQSEVDVRCEARAGVEVPTQCFDMWYIPDNGNC